jgi:hypothetical protein
MIFLIHSPKYGIHKVEIDDEDWDKIKDIRWHVHYGFRKGCPYLIGVLANVRKNGKRTTPALHQIIMPECRMIDHKNANPLDNRKNNLRPCTPTTNTQNARVYYSNTSGYKGVSEVTKKVKYAREGKIKTYVYKQIIAQIMINKKSKFLGIFKTKEDAARAYNEAAVKHFGEFARLNVL